MKAKPNEKTTSSQSATRPACWLRAGPRAPLVEEGGRKLPALSAPAWLAPWRRPNSAAATQQVQSPFGPQSRTLSLCEHPPCSRQLLLGLLLPVCFPPRYVPGLDFQREFPQGLLSQVVTKVVEEVYDVVVSPDVVMPGGEEGSSECPRPLNGNPLPPSKPLWQAPCCPRPTGSPSSPDKVSSTQSPR